MKVGILLSSGKDSVLAMHRAVEKHEISCLITIVSENAESYMFHTPNINLATAQSECLEIPLLISNTKGEKEKELSDLKNVIKKAILKYKIQGIVTGAIASNYQASRIQKICDELKIECINPLWQIDQIELLKELIRKKFEVIIVGIFAYPFTEKWLGRKINEKTTEELKELWEKYKINPAGEGGEIETLVLNAPMFKKKISIKKSSKKYLDNSGVLKIEEYSLSSK